MSFMVLTFQNEQSPKSSFLTKPKCIIFSFKASPYLIVTLLITLKKELHFRIFLLSWKKQWLSCSLHNLVVLWNWKIGVHQVIFICETLINQPYPEGARLCFRHHSTPRWSHSIHTISGLPQDFMDTPMLRPWPFSSCSTSKLRESVFHCLGPLVSNFLCEGEISYD